MKSSSVPEHAVEIERANVDDLDGIAALNAQVQRMHAEQYPSIMKQPELKEITGVLQERMKDNSDTVLVARSNSELLGYALVRVDERPENPFSHGRKIVEVDQMAVDEKHRGKGVGTLLIDKAIEFGRSQHADWIQLSVWEHNEGVRAFYERSGFGTLTRKMGMKL